MAKTKLNPYIDDRDVVLRHGDCVGVGITREGHYER